MEQEEEEEEEVEEELVVEKHEWSMELKYSVVENGGAWKPLK